MDPSGSLNEKFAARYWNDPVAWVNDCIIHTKGGPAAYQEDVLAHVPKERRVSVRGLHGLGKSTLMAWAVLWFATTRDSLGVDWKVLTLASVWRQLERYLWPEIHKWARRLNWVEIGREPFTERELLQLSLRLKTGEAFAVASDNPESIEGAHADYILYIFDEAKIIPDATWNSAEGAFSSGLETYWLSASTPGEPLGRFYQIQTKVRGYSDWWVRHVTLDEAVQAGRVSRDWAEARRIQWGENSAAYKNRVLGEFAESSSDGVIPLAWVEKAIDRWYDFQKKGSPKRLTAFAVDVGRGGDPSTIAPRYEMFIPTIFRSDTSDTMNLVGEVISHVGSREIPIVIDIIGLGAGVYDRLNEQKYNVVSFIANESTLWESRSGNFRFSDTRSAAWWNARELLDPFSGYGLALPPDDEDLLIGDLTSPTWKYMSDGKIKVESKDVLRARLGRSTDYGDVIIMSLWAEGSSRQVTWEDLVGLSHVEGYVSRWV